MTVLQHLLCKLAEEGSEVAQMALKTAYFGLDEVYEVKPNRERLHGELNDLMAVVEMLNENFGLGYTPSPEQIVAKKEKVSKYLAYSQSLGLTVAPPEDSVSAEELPYRALKEYQVVEPTPSRRASDRQVGGSHYKDMPIEPSEFSQKNGLNWCEANAVKYVCRHRSKNGVQDIEKAIHYLQLLLEWEYGEAKEVSPG